MTAPLLADLAPLADAARCNRRRLNGTRLCSMPGDVLLTAMCVHEHLLTSRYCEAHAAEVLAGTPRSCEPCYRSTERHTCVVRVLASEVAS